MKKKKGIIDLQFHTWHTEIHLNTKAFILYYFNLDSVTKSYKI